MNTISNPSEAPNQDLYVNMTTQWAEERRAARRNKVVRLPAPPPQEAPEPIPSAPDPYTRRAAVCTLLMALAVAVVLVILGTAA